MNYEANRHSGASIHSGLLLAAAVFALALVRYTEAAAPESADDGASSGNSSEMQKFLREYPTHCAKLIDYYNNMYIKGKEIRYIPRDMAAAKQQINEAKDGERPNIPMNEIMTEWEIRGRDGSLSYERVIRNGQSTLADVVSSKMSFHLAKKPGTKSFIIERLWDDQSNDVDKLRHNIWEACVGLSGPYAVRGMPISSLLNDKSYRFFFDDSKQGGDRDSVRVDWEKKSADGGGIQRGYFRFAKNLSYALTDHEVVAGLGPAEIKAGVPKWKMHWTLKYVENKDEIPLLQSIDAWRWNERGVGIHDRMTEVQRIEHVKIPESDFTFDHYGIKTSAVAPPRPAWVYLVGLSLGAFLCAAMLRPVRAIITRAA